MTAYINLEGTMLDDKHDNAILIRVPPNWNVWLPRSVMRPNGGLRVNTKTRAVSCDVAAWKVEQLIRDGELPASVRMPARAAIVRNDSNSEAPETTDERFARKGQEKT